MRVLPSRWESEPRPRQFFPPEDKAEIVELICTTGKTVGQVAGEPLAGSVVVRTAPAFL
jgi:hypothetical protein